MRLRITLYVTTCSILAGVAVAFVATTTTAGSVRQIVAALCYAGLSLLSELLSYRKTRQVGSHGSIAFLPILAAMLLSPTWVTVVAIGVSHMIDETIGRREIVKSVFNVAQGVLALSVSIIVFTLRGGRSIITSPFAPLAAILAIMAFFGVNRFAVAGVVSLSSGRSLLTILKESTQGVIVYDLLALPFAYIFASVYVSLNVWGAAALAIPLFGLRELYKKNEELRSTNQELLELMVAAIEARDPYTSGHSRRVSENARIIARELGLREKLVERVAVAALLHDVGKIHEDFARILQKPGRLSPDELAVMRAHPVRSAELVSRVSQLHDLVEPIRHHHENWDGSGYPDGLAGDAIPMMSRIISFADTIDAMTTDRPYRRAMDETAVRKELIKWRGRQFDPTICDVLLTGQVLGSMVCRQIAAVPSESRDERRTAGF